MRTLDDMLAYALPLPAGEGRGEGEWCRQTRRSQLSPTPTLPRWGRGRSLPHEPC